MPPTEMKPEAVSRLALGGAITGLVCAVALAMFWRLALVRAVAGSVGLMAAALGGGLGLWCGLRLRDRRCYLAALLSFPSLALWGWLISLAIRG